MLVIRTAQMATLREAQWEILAQRLEDHLRKTLPIDYERLGNAAAHALATCAVERGRAYGMTRELDFFRFFNLLFLLGEDADTAPWAAEILSDNGMQTATKLHLLEQECRDRGKWD
jgi:hypothetical protein